MSLARRSLEFGCPRAQCGDELVQAVLLEHCKILLDREWWFLEAATQLANHGTHEIGFHAIKPGLDFTLPPVESTKSSKALFGARDAETGEVEL